MRRIHLVAGAVLLLIAALAGGWYALSPGWTVKAMVEAARSGDEARFSAHVDYPALRADMKTELASALEEEAKRNAGAQGKLALAFGMALMGPMVDRMVSPEAMKTAFAGLAEAEAGRGGSGKSSNGGGGKVGQMPEIRRDGFNRFVVSARDRPESGLVFERDGLGWKLTGIELPGGGGNPVAKQRRRIGNDPLAEQGPAEQISLASSLFETRSFAIKRRGASKTQSRAERWSLDFGGRKSS